MMARSRPLLLSSWLTMLAACTSSSPPPNEQPNEQPGHEPPTLVPEPIPNKPSPLGELMNEVILEEIEDFHAHACACDGARLRQQFLVHSPAEIEQFIGGERPSVQLLAIWERDRRFAADGSLVPASLDRFVRALEAAIGRRPSGWWIDQLASAKLRPGDDGGPPSYDVGLTEHGDRRGTWQAGPGGTRVRTDGAMLLSETAGQLSYDFSVGRVVLGPLPSDPGTMIEHVRVFASTIVYYATFSQGSGGFRFPLHAVDSKGKLKWTAEVCGPNRQMLGGVGHLIVEIVPTDAGIAVFTAESHGVALDVFDPDTGARTLAWSSDFWFAR